MDSKCILINAMRKTYRRDFLCW